MNYFNRFQVLTLFFSAVTYRQGAFFEFQRESDYTVIRHTVPSSEAFSSVAASTRLTGTKPPEDWNGGWGEGLWHPDIAKRN